MDENVVDIAGRRETILDLLRDGPHAKRDIIDETGRSRSTVDRAVESLLDAGLVLPRDGGYETTLAGVLALEAHRAYDREARAISTAAPALEPLWKEAPVSRAFVRDATVMLVGESRTATPQRVVERAVRNADRVQATVPTTTSGAFLDAIRDAAVESSVPVTLVCSPEQFEATVRDRPGWLRQVVLEGEGQVLTADVPGFGLLVTAGPDGEVATLETYDEGRLHAVLQADTDAAVAWADETLDRLVEGSVDTTDRIRRLPDDRVDGTTTPGPVTGGPTATAGPEETASDVDGLLGSGFGVDHGRLRTPQFGAEGASTVALWVVTDGFDTDWETLVKWDYLALCYRRGELYGQVYDPDAELSRARAAVSADRIDPNEWHHLAYTYDESVARLHLDGAVVAETEDEYPLEIRPLGAAVGYHYWNRDTGVHEPTFEGRIADARFYEVALDGDAVQRLYRGTRPRDG